MIELGHVDGGQGFDFGRTANDYGRYRDIYPASFYETLLGFGIGTPSQRILDLGTGTGVIPRNMARHGAAWIGADISPDQVSAARALSQDRGLDIEYIVCPADKVPLADRSVDGVTACQCFWYFDIETTIPEVHRLLRPGGRFAILSMVGLPRGSEILAKSEELVLKFNPTWSSADFDRRRLEPPDWLGSLFSVIALHDYVEDFPFTRESWCGRMRTCRGVGASLPPEMVEAYDREHYQALCEIADEAFTIPHQLIFQVYQRI